MRRSPSPLRVTSSPSAELGVDVGGRPQLRSAFLSAHKPGTRVSQHQVRTIRGFN